MAENQAELINEIEFNLTREDLDKADDVSLQVMSGKGITEDVVRMISKHKKEPAWMLELRLKALQHFKEKATPTWGPDLSSLNINEIIPFLVPNAKESKNWSEVPKNIRDTFDRLGIPEAEKKYLSGVGAQMESQMVYHNLKEEWAKKGVIFENMDVALQKYPDLVKKYFMTKCIPINDHKFISLHGAVWSGGTFIYVPEGVSVTIPLQAYFRMNAKGAGQFEHTLIVAEKNSEVHYIEGCSAPQHGVHSLHAGCVEVYVGENARVRYSSVENWSKNTFNLNTKRAIVEKNGFMEWIGGNMGCLTGDTLISTNPKGPTQISKLQAGDTVFAFDEKEKKIKRAKVKAMIYSGDKEVFKVEAGGRSIEASTNHPFLVVERKTVPTNKRKGKFVSTWKSLEFLKEGDIIAIARKLPDFGTPYTLPSMEGYKKRKYTGKNQYGTEFTMTREHLYNDYTFPTETTEDLLWFLGVLIGDGYVHIPKKHGAKINVAIPETCDLREPLIDVIKKLFNYDVTYKKDRFIIINSRPIAEFLQMIGFTGTAITKSLPRWIHTLPTDQKLAFLGGYFDSDGHVNEGGVYITSVNKSLLEDVRELALSCGIGFSRIFSHRIEGKVMILGNACNSRDSYRLLLNGPNVSTIKTRSLSAQNDFRKIVSRRNYARAKGWNFASLANEDVGFARIDKIVSQGIKPTFDIEVENYHNFVANGMIVHNSGVTMLYPCSVLKGECARAEHTGIAFAGKGQNQDTGAKVYHLAKNTTSIIKSKSICKDGGITTYRGLVKVIPGAKNSKIHVSCDAMMLDELSKNNTVPTMTIQENDVHVAHEATVGKLSTEQIFYLMSRGLTEQEATAMIVNGFIEPITKNLPLEYAIELNRLIELELEGSVG